MIIHRIFRPVMSPIFILLTDVPPESKNPTLVLDFINQTYAVEG